MPNIKIYSKVNTYTRRPSKEQIIAYLAMLLELSCFYAILFEKLGQVEYRIPILISYTFCLIAMIVAYLYVSCIDPTDDYVIRTAFNQDTLM